MIPYGRQDINEADLEAVRQVLLSDFLTQGPQVPAFEAAVRNYCSAQYAFAMNSATSALHVACMAMGLKEGGLLWTSPVSFVASSNCALYCGAEVDFVDVDAATYNMSADALRQKLEAAKAAGKLPDIVVPVHLCGQSCDMKAIHALSRQYGFKVIEDASHAIGAKYLGKPVGSCEYSDITIFSFHPVKIVTSAEGGMLMTNDAKIAERVELLRSHGITRNPDLMQSESEGPWYYEQIDLGYNYRMTELQGALGLSQMSRLDAFVARRHEIKTTYDAALAALPVKIPYQDTDAHSSLHLYVVRLDLDRCKHSHRETFELLRKKGIGVNLHYMPIYRQPYYRQFGFSKDDFPNAEQYYKEAISLPMFPTLTAADQQAVIDTLAEVTTR